MILRVNSEGGVLLVDYEHIYQYSDAFNNLVVLTPFGYGNTVEVSFKKPNGYVIQRIMMSYDGALDQGVYMYSCPIISGYINQAGQLWMSFSILMTDGTTRLNTAIYKHTVEPSLLSPNQTITNPDLVEELRHLISQRALAADMGDPLQLPTENKDSLVEAIIEIYNRDYVRITEHDQLTTESREKPNQHPIEAITGLKPKVNIHIGETAPNPNDALIWLDTIGQVVVDPSWVVSISEYNVGLHSSSLLQEISPTNQYRLIATGVEDGVIQEYTFEAAFIGDNLMITGEMPVLVDNTFGIYQIALFEIVIDGNTVFCETYIENGNEDSTQFTARLEAWK